MDYVDVFIYSVNIIVMTFTVFLFVLSDSIVFGSNMVFLIVQFPKQKYDQTFVLFTLLITYIFNYKNSIDNSTYCGNAIYSIVLFVICLLYGAFYFYNIKEEAFQNATLRKKNDDSSSSSQQPPQQKQPTTTDDPLPTLFEIEKVPFPYRSYVIYFKFLMILLMDWFYQPYARDEWYLFSCFVVFIGNNKILKVRYLIPFLGFVIGNFNRSLSQWIWYTFFCIVMFVTDVFFLI